MRPDMMMKQAQQQMRRLQQVQEELGKLEMTGSAGGGAIKVTVGGEFDVKKVEIAPEVIDPSDPQMLADLLMAAVNDAIGNLRKVHQAKMSAVTGGMKIPGLF